MRTFFSGTATMTRLVLAAVVIIHHLSLSVFAKISFHEIQIRKQLQQLEQKFTEAEQRLRLKADNFRTSPSAAPPEQLVTPILYNGTVRLPINHFGRSPRPYTFTNRFWIVDEYYKEGGPVFTLDTGETNDAYDYRQYLTSNLSFINQYLREFNALGVLWEHRYYGQSLPYPINLDTRSEQMQWLTTEQALKDFEVFAKSFRWRIGKRASGKKDSIVGKTVNFDPRYTPWIHIGGSYPGMRAAMLRDKYPDTIFAAYASSAPVQASYNMTFYWDQVYRGMVEYGLANCTSNIHKALEYIDSQLDLPERATLIKILFLGRTGENNSNEVFSDALFYPMYNWQSLGASDDILQDFCRVLEKGNTPQDRREPTGKVLADRWAKWPTFIELVNAYNPSGYCEGFTTQNAKKPDCRLNERFEGTLSISWTWQYCTEWGFLQASNIGPNSLGSKYNTLEHQQEICYRQFPDGLSSGYLPLYPHVGRMNYEYGGWEMRPSNTFWTGGEFDPWKTLTPLSTESFSLRTPITQQIPKCNVSPASEKSPLFGYHLENSEHCYDFDPAVNNPAAAAPQRLFADALKIWLRCFLKR